MNNLEKTIRDQLLYGLKIDILNKPCEVLGLLNQEYKNKGIQTVFMSPSVEEHPFSLLPINQVVVQCPIHPVKPYLRPLSDLTKPIEHNGDKFTPIQVLFEIMRYPPNSYICEKIHTDESVHVLRYKLDHAGSIAGRFWYHEKQQSFVSFEGKSFTRTKNQMTAFEKLKEWHFNIHLLDPDSFITVTDENNPYK